MSSIVRFSKYLRQGVPYKAKNWHPLSHEQYFSKHRFLDICRCAFKENRKINSRLNTALSYQLYIYQSGFRANHSTDTFSSRLTDMIVNGSKNGNHTGMILIDLQKALTIQFYDLKA